MINLFAQVVLARRSPDDEGWMNILVVIVMAVIWIIGGIVKAMKTKASEQQPSRSSTRKMPPHGRGAQQQMPGQAQPPAGPAPHPIQPSAPPQKRLTLADLREAARKFAAEAERAFQQPQPPKSSPTPRPKPPSQAVPVPGPSTTPASLLTEPPVDRPTDRLRPQPAAPQRSGLLADYADPDKLKQAILHYEILGPPLSLRD